MNPPCPQCAGNGGDCPLCGGVGRITIPMDDLIHSDAFVLMFLGFMSAKLPELRALPAERLLQLWDDFNREMGKR